MDRLLDRLILHVDMDAFFVACEVRRDPSLAGKPLIVGGNPDGRGVVATASYEARKFGIHSAMPSSQAKRRCPHAIFVRGHFEDYVETSGRLRTLFEEFTPVVEMASLDEAYLDLSGTARLWGSPVETAERLRARIQEKENLPASFGIATTKGVAKIASDLHKPNGLTWVPPGEEAEFLAPLSLRRLPGVGPKTLERLQGWGIKTIGDLAAVGQEKLSASLGQAGEGLWRRAVGRDTGEVHPNSERKSLGRETTFDIDVKDMGEATATLSRLAEEVGERLRRKGFRAHRLTLKIRDTDFHTVTRALTFSTPTQLDGDLFSAARTLLEKNWTNRAPLRLLGISTSGLVQEETQLDLIADADRERQGALAAACDSIRARHGAGAIRRGSSTPGKGALPPWETGGAMADPE
jgi:DNA polymerase-4